MSAPDLYQAPALLRAWDVFKTGNMDRGDIEDWLGEKHASKVQFDRVVLLAAIIVAVTGVLTFAHDYFK